MMWCHADTSTYKMSVVGSTSSTCDDVHVGTSLAKRHSSRDFFAQTASVNLTQTANIRSTNSLVTVSAFGSLRLTETDFRIPKSWQHKVVVDGTQDQLANCPLLNARQRVVLESCVKESWFARQWLSILPAYLTEICITFQTPASNSSAFTTYLIVAKTGMLRC